MNKEQLIRHISSRAVKDGVVDGLLVGIFIPLFKNTDFITQICFGSVASISVSLSIIDVTLDCLKNRRSLL